ncbi:glycosyltransferase family 2 protein [Oenococcus oeni]|nr:glycosyltransferase family 2 protein [Oenococcus oeni]
MNKVNVSIIIPVFNVKNFVQDSFLSAAKQSYASKEIILIDDGSTDGSGSIVESFTKYDIPIKIFHTKNRGLSAARNLGIKKACGEFIYFLDSDDLIDPHLIEDTLTFATQNHLDFVSFTNDFIDESNKLIHKKLNNSEYKQNRIIDKSQAISLLFIEKMRISAWSYIVRKSVFVENNIFFPVNKKYEDNCTTPLVVWHSKNIGFLGNNGRPYYHYRMRTGSITHKFNYSNVDDMLYMINLNQKNFSNFSSLDFYICSKSLATFFISSKNGYYRVSEINSQIKDHLSFQFALASFKNFLKFGYWLIKGSSLFFSSKHIGENKGERNRPKR